MDLVDALVELGATLADDDAGAHPCSAPWPFTAHPRSYRSGPGWWTCMVCGDEWPGPNY
jgi:ribosomal protein L37AE/L43A